MLSLKEKNINKNFTEIQNFWFHTPEAIVVKNYDPDFVYYYGNIDDLVRYSGNRWSYKYKRLWHRIHNNSSYLTPNDIDSVFGDHYSEIVDCYIKKSDVAEIWKKNYIILKKGGVYSIRENYWYTRKDFFELRKRYDNGCAPDYFKLNNEEYFKWKNEPEDDYDYDDYDDYDEWFDSSDENEE